MPYTNHGTGYQKTDTSAAAAIGMEKKSTTLQRQVLEYVRGASRPVSTEEIAAALDRPYGSIQPRLSELKNKGKIEDSGQRGTTRWGKSCILWAAANPNNA